MSSDRQDFLERKEARLRRMQQDAAASRSSSKAGKSQPVPTSKTQKPAFPQRKGASEAGQQAQKAKPASVPDTKPATPPAGQPEKSPAGRPAGRRSAARREQQSIRPLSSAPKPSLLSRLIVWGTMAIGALLVLATLGEAWTVHRLNQQVSASQQAVNQLQNQNHAIATQNTQLQQPETIESEARQLGYIYPGDQPVVVVTTQPAPSAEPQPSTSSARGWWGFWPDWLKLFLFQDPQSGSS